MEEAVRGDDVSRTQIKPDDEHVDPLIGGLNTPARADDGLKWRIAIALAVLIALVAVVVHQAF
jgi:hypothetical protein